VVTLHAWLTEQGKAMQSLLSDAGLGDLELAGMAADGQRKQAGYT